MTLKLNGTNSVAAPAYAGDDADTGLQCGTNELKLVTGGSARATVDSSGNIGVGVTPSSWGGSRNAIQFNSSGAAYICNDEPLAVVSNMYFNGSNNKYINTNPASQVLFNTGSTQFLYAGSGTAGNNISFSTAATIDTHGIKFQGDTAAANALDDYEEGVWTPQAFNNANSASTNSTSNRAAKYIKVGRLVHICCYILVNKGSNTGNFEINNLPYPTDTNNDLHAGISVGYFDGLNTSISMMLATAQPNSSKLLMRMVSGTGAGSISTLRGTHLNSTMNVIVGGTYIASS